LDVLASAQVLASPQVAGIDPEKPNPARWKNWLDHTLPRPKSSACEVTMRQ
jgi:hypothetical protein